MLQNLDICSHTRYVFIKVLLLGYINKFLHPKLFSLFAYHYDYMNVSAPRGETLTVFLLLKCEIKYCHARHTM